MTARYQQSSFIHALAQFLRRVPGLILIMLVLINVANASSRYLLGWSPPGADEAMVYLMIVVVTFGAVLALWQRQHICINLVPGLLSACAQRRLFLLHDLVGLGAFAIAAWWSYAYVRRIAMLETRSMALGLPMSWPHSVLLLGLASLALVCLWRIIAAFRWPSSGLSSCQPRQTEHPDKPNKRDPFGRFSQ